MKPSSLKIFCITGVLCLPIAHAVPETPDGWLRQQQGDQWLLKPDDLPAGFNYQIVVFPPTALKGQDLAGWLKAVMKKDMAKRGKVIQDMGIREQHIYQIGTAEVETAQGPQVLMYFAFAADNSLGQVMLVQSDADQRKAGHYNSATSGILVGLSDQLQHEKASPQQAQGTPAAPPANASSAKPAENEDAFRWTTQPGKGIAASSIQGIYMAYVPKFNARSLSYEFKERLVLLLKDGTAYLGLRVPPEDLDLKASRKHEPDQWTKWKTSGSNILLLTSGKWEAMKSKQMVPAQKGEKINGNFEHIKNNANPFSGGSILEEHYLFRKDGTFEIRNSAEHAAMNSGANVSAYSEQDSQGSRGSVSTSAGVGSSSNENKNDPGRYGSYQLSGYTLVLKLKNGQVQRKLFFFTSNKKNELFIEKATYFPPSQ